MMETRGDLLSGGTMFQPGSTLQERDMGKMTLPRIKPKKQLYTIKDDKLRTKERFIKDFPANMSTRMVRGDVRKWGSKT